MPPPSASGVTGNPTPRYPVSSRPTRPATTPRTWGDRQSRTKKNSTPGPTRHPSMGSHQSPYRSGSSYPADTTYRRPTSHPPQQSLQDRMSTSRIELAPYNGSYGGQAPPAARPVAPPYVPAGMRAPGTVPFPGQTPYSPAGAWTSYSTPPGYVTQPSSAPNSSAAMPGWVPPRGWVPPSGWAGQPQGDRSIYHNRPPP